MKDRTLVSFDVINLYSNIPTADTLDIASELIVEHYQDNEFAGNINGILKHVVKQNYCKFNDKYYKMEDGLPMGMSISGILADIYLNKIENDFIINNNNPYRKGIIEWMRYVDDVFCVWEGDQRELHGMLDYINSIHPKLKFYHRNTKL